MNEALNAITKKGHYQLTENATNAIRKLIHAVMEEKYNVTTIRTDFYSKTAIKALEALGLEADKDFESNWKTFIDFDVEKFLAGVWEYRNSLTKNLVYPFVGIGERQIRACFRRFR